MGLLGMDRGRPPLQPRGPPTVTKRDMEHIRRVFDEDSASKKLCSIISPREDAQIFRSVATNARTVPCECIVELYELLWRWGHRDTDQPGFLRNVGFTIPDTIVIHKGKPYAWYFISKKDGSLLRKKDVEKGGLGAVEKKLCGRERKENEICAVWYPVASQFKEARSESCMAQFFNVDDCSDFIADLAGSEQSGIIQQFVEPLGVSNFLVRTVRYMGQTSLSVRTNRSLLTSGRGSAFDRCATFEGWEGLSSSCSRYRSNIGDPNTEDLILECGDMLNERIEQDHVRHMLFLEPTQHIALHFKVSKDKLLYFIYASVVSEKDVILQTRPQLLMRDLCMTEELPCQALLPGGTSKKAKPHEAPACTRPRKERQQEAQAALQDMRSLLESDGSERSRREGSLPPLGAAPASRSSDKTWSDSGLSARRSRSAQPSKPSVLPMMQYSRPVVPTVPFQMHSLQHSCTESGRYEYAPPFLGQEVVKQPLVTPASSRTERPPRPWPPPQGSLSARAEPGGPALVTAGRDFAAAT